MLAVEIAPSTSLWTPLGIYQGSVSSHFIDNKHAIYDTCNSTQRMVSAKVRVFRQYYHIHEVDILDIAADRVKVGDEACSLPISRVPQTAFFSLFLTAASLRPMVSGEE